MMLLGVNIDHIATLRQARRGIDPDPIMAVPLAILGGADGITVHLREDRRHIQDRDLEILKKIVPVELNLEMAVTEEMLSIAEKIKPDLVTLVPEKRMELTTEGGLDVEKHKLNIKKAIERLHRKDIPVSLFINPDKNVIKLSREVGSDMVEIHTGTYANAKGKSQENEFERVKNSVKYALECKLLVNAGHGLNYFNVKKIAEIYEIRGLYIGHSIISRAVFIGLEQAVREMKQLIKR
ncbi:MAG: pyridoxine 5'-phosphate synthase [Nitrospirae bacterium]|nr:pyridoxine 5'-phosphate synthase [Nitrospirota bacterium]